MDVPIGAVVFGVVVVLAIAPIRRPRRVGRLSWMLTAVPNELPVQFGAIVVVSTLPGFLDGDLTARDRASLVITSMTLVGFVVIAGQALRARRVVADALEDGLGPGHAPRRGGSWWRILLVPWPSRPRRVERTADIAYGPGGTANLLDVYRHRSHPESAPTLIYLHGGGFRSGSKKHEGRPLLHRLAGAGWTCISANYRLAATPAAGFPGHLVDVKRVIAWARTQGLDHGVDPDRIVLAGSSAGAHLTAMAACTANDPRFQPGFEEADTSVAAGVGLYGYYGQLADGMDPPTSPNAYVHPRVPPLFVIHGDNDTYTPVEGARELVGNLRRVATAPVVYAELPGAQHSFDVFHSIRFEAVVDGIESFLRSRVRERSGNTPPDDDIQASR